ncbi:MAG TPA: carboxypeptidase regulatory-like domain-containing protein, partial [Niastella sp.]|nr:carboxypeptidase regulatory-like domain-containing protein [Niastella sp.]
MKRLTPIYTEASGKLREQLNSLQVRRSPTKALFQRIIMPAFTFVLFLPFAFAQKGTITGRVTGNEGAIQSATVTAAKTSVLTDDKGSFSMSLNPGNHTIVITHTGYKEVMQELTIENGNTKNIEVVLIRGAELGEVVVLGSRSLVQRSNLNTVVPVDVFTSKQLEQTGQVSLTQMLNYSAPSFNASRPHN